MTDFAELEDLLGELSQRELRFIASGRRVYEVLVRRRGLTQVYRDVDGRDLREAANAELRRRRRERRI